MESRLTAILEMRRKPLKIAQIARYYTYGTFLHF